MSGSTIIEVKWDHHGAKHRFRLKVSENESSFNAFYGMARALVNYHLPEKFCLGWEDDEHDIIVIQSDVGLRAALDYRVGHILRIVTTEIPGGVPLEASPFPTFSHAPSQWNCPHLALSTNNHPCNSFEAIEDVQNETREAHVIENETNGMARQQINNLHIGQSSLFQPIPSQINNTCKHTEGRQRGCINNNNNTYDLYHIQTRIDQQEQQHQLQISPTTTLPLQQIDEKEILHNNVEETHNLTLTLNPSDPSRGINISQNKGETPIMGDTTILEVQPAENIKQRTEKEKTIAELMEMGFTRRNSELAVEQCGPRPDFCVTYIVDITQRRD